MKNKRIIGRIGGKILLGGLFVLLLPAGLFAGATREEERRFSLAGVDTLVINYQAARVILREADGEELVLIERLRNAEDAEVLTEGRDLRITGDKRWQIFFSSRRIEAEIGIPRSFRGNLRIQTGSGSIHSDAHFVSDGTVDIKVSSGNLNLGRIEAREIKLHSSSGAILAAGLSGITDIDLASGNITLGSLEGERHRLRSLSGSVRVEKISGATDIELSSGRIQVGSLEGERHRLRSMSGSVTVDVLSGAAVFSSASGNMTVGVRELSGDLSFDIKSGGLDLSLPSGTAFNLDAESSSGRIRVNSPEGEYFSRDRSSILRPIGENPRYTIFVRVSSGHINIDRR